MNINGAVDFLHQLFYKTFEILPILGNGANYLFLSAMGVIFLYWLNIIRKTAND